MCSFGEQWLSLCRGTIPNSDVVARVQHGFGERGAHQTKTEDADAAGSGLHHSLLSDYFRLFAVPLLTVACVIQLPNMLLNFNPANYCD
jgi:hypothetical protein